MAVQHARASALPGEIEAETLFIALHDGVGVPAASLPGLAPPEQPATAPQIERAMMRFLLAAAMPEPRLVLAGRCALSYEDLTSWLTRADLLRVDCIGADLAELLVLAGIKGVHDLAAWREWTTADGPLSELVRRTGSLASDIEKSIASLDDPDRQRHFLALLAGLDLQQIVEHATTLAWEGPPQIVSTTDVIIVTKGAGSQKSGEALNDFVNGFWPAIRAIEPAATMTRRFDLTLPSASEPTDGMDQRAITEIVAGEHRIWVTESHWESWLRPPDAIHALFLEWRMTTFAFGRHIYQFVKEQSQRAHTGRRAPRQAVGRAALVEHYLSFVLQYIFIFLFLGRVFWSRGALDVPLLGRFVQDPWVVGGLALLFALLAALPLALRTHHVIQKEPLMRLPTLPEWLLLVLIVAFLNEPLRYLQGLVLLWLVQMGILAGRDMAWPYRLHPDSDTDLSEYDLQQDEQGRTFIVQRRVRSQKLLLSPVLYRYMIVLIAPMMLALLTIARMLKLTVILRPIGGILEAMVEGTLSGVLGDVVTYAMDPARAHHMRSIIEADIAYFHRQRDVDQIHLFAYSQGTPITFELLFHHLAPHYRHKVQSFITIGSILSYYHQAGPVLDEIQAERFPVPRYLHFAEGFRWYNFWNTFDPITEFSALDEFKLYEIRRAGDGDSKAFFMEPSAANPVNIRTMGVAAPWSGHTDYWRNLQEVQIPFAFRLLDDLDRPEWQPRSPRSLPGRLSYTSLLTVLVAPILLMLATAVIVMRQVSTQLATQLLLMDGAVGAGLQLPDAVLALLAETLERFPSQLVLEETLFLVSLVLLVGATLSTRLVIVRLIATLRDRPAQAA